jgi:hypothetical protein
MAFSLLMALLLAAGGPSAIHSIHSSKVSVVSQSLCTVKVSGEDHPEFIPTHAAWEMMLRNTLRLAQTESGDLDPVGVRSFSRYTFGLPESDVRNYFAFAARALEQLDAMRAAHDAIHGSEPGETPKQHWEFNLQVAQLIMDLRDDFGRSVSREVFAAVKRVALKQARSTIVHIPVPCQN